MILSDPIPWSDVPAGAVVLHFGTPRRVMHRREDVERQALHFLIENSPEWIVTKEAAPYFTTQLVTLDETDAMINMLNAGLVPETITTEEAA